MRKTAEQFQSFLKHFLDNVNPDSCGTANDSRITMLCVNKRMACADEGSVGPR